MRQRSRQIERLAAPWLEAKYVGASPFYAKGGYFPMNESRLAQRRCRSSAAASVPAVEARSSGRGDTPSARGQL
jgi:hypothetical protein